MDEREPSGIAIEVFERIGAANSDPAEIKFHLDQVRVTGFEQKVVGQFSVDREKFEPVVVIGELNAGLLAGFSGSVESVGGALPYIRLLAVFLRDPRTDHVAPADGFRGLALRR